MAFLPLDGPGVHGAISVTSTPVELKVGASVLEERTIVTMKPLNGDIYYGYSNAVTVATGTLVKKGQFWPLEAGDSLSVWLVSAGTVDTRITEVG